MKLFYLVPSDPPPIHLLCLFLGEALLLLANYPLFLAGMYLLIRTRIVRNIKIFTISLFAQYLFCMTGRLVLLGFQSGSIPGGGDPEKNVIIVLCSWLRCYVFAKIFGSLFFASFERGLCVYFIEDYEFHDRLWIPILITLTSAGSSVISSYIYTFEYLPWYLPAMLGVGTSALGVILFFLIIQYTKVLNNLVRNKKHKSIHYSLGVRYQLEETLWCAKILKNGYITLGLINIVTFCLFLPANVSLAKDYFSEEWIAVFDCLYNIFIALNGPIVAVGAVYYNEYLLGAVKLMFHSKLDVPSTEAGQLYFIQLRKQWEIPRSPEVRSSESTNSHNTVVPF